MSDVSNQAGQNKHTERAWRHSRVPKAKCFGK